MSRQSSTPREVRSYDLLSSIVGLVALITTVDARHSAHLEAPLRLGAFDVAQRSARDVSSTSGMFAKPLTTDRSPPSLYVSDAALLFCTHGDCCFKKSLRNQLTTE